MSKTTVAFFFLLFSALLLQACSGSSAYTLPIITTPNPSGINKLGRGDVFDVRVFDEESLSGTYRVGPDGTISVPLIGVLPIEGLSPDEVGEKLAESLRTYLKRPHVSVFVREYNSKKVFVFGHVKTPGTFTYEESMNVIQAITMAGGYDLLANRHSAFVTRSSEGQETRINVNIDAISEGRERNFELKPGDIVYVPESIF